MVLLSIIRASYVRDCLGAMLAVLACWAAIVSAGEIGAPAPAVPRTIIVTGQKPAADEEVR